MDKRKNKPDAIFEAVFPLGGVLLLVGIMAPVFQHGMMAVGMMILWILGLVFFGLLGFLVIRMLARNTDECAWELGMQRMLQAERSLPAGDMDTQEMVQTKPAGKPCAPPDDPRFKPQVRVSSSPSIWREVAGLAPGVEPAELMNPGEVPNATSGSALEKRTFTTGGLLARLSAIDWYQFEKVVARLYEKLGYTVSRRGGAKPDGGIDLIIEKPGIRWAVQCKQWKNTEVEVKAIHEFVTALQLEGLSKGTLVTLRGYSAPAQQLAEEQGIEMVDASELARKLEAVEARYDVEILDLLADTSKYCPRCEAEMVLKTLQKGASAGSRFWSCSAYPCCRYTLPGD